MVSKPVVALEPTLGWRRRAVRAVAASARGGALHPAVAVGDAVLVRFGAAAQRRLRVAAVFWVRAAAVVLVVLLEALLLRGAVLLVARVGGVVALKVEVALVLVAAVVKVAKAEKPVRKHCSDRIMLTEH